MLDELEAEVTIETTTDTTLKYKMVRNSEGLVSLERTITTAQGSNTIATTLNDIVKDGNQLLNVALHLRYMLEAQF